MSEEIVVYDPNGKLTVLAQVRAYPKTSLEWAAEMVDEILLDDDDRPPYLILVTLDQTYFWRNPAEQPTPMYAVATDELLQKHLRRLDKVAQTVPYGVLEMIIFDWIADATRDASDVPELLRAIGFTDAIRKGRVTFETAA